MSKNLVNAKSDVVFKKIFADDTHLLTVLISDILDIPIETIKIKPRTAIRLGRRKACTP